MAMHWGGGDTTVLQERIRDPTKSDDTNLLCLTFCLTRRSGGGDGWGAGGGVSLTRGDPQTQHLRRPSDRKLFWKC